ncbi:MAG: GNAT family N-acetyltransferase [Phycisphaerales bacterium]
MQIHRTGPETDRLRHRAFTPDDAPAFFALNSDPEVMRFTGETPVASLGDAAAAIASYPDFETVGFGRWACVRKDTGAVIGFCGLKRLPDLHEVDIGYRLLPAHWGQGFATEACAACMRFGFERIGLERIIALVLPANTRSIRVLEKVGLRPEGEVVYEGLRALQYAAARDWWTYPTR